MNRPGIGIFEICNRIIKYTFLGGGVLFKSVNRNKRNVVPNVPCTTVTVVG